MHGNEERSDPSFPVFAGWAVVKFAMLFGVLLTVVSHAKSREGAASTSNALFAIVAAVAALCFTWSSVLEAGSWTRAKATRLGEEFFLAAILYLVASAIKLGAIEAHEALGADYAGGWMKGLLWVYLGMLVLSTVLAMFAMFRLMDLLLLRVAPGLAPGDGD